MSGTTTGRRRRPALAAVALASALALTVTACGGDDGGDSSAEAKPDTSADGAAEDGGKVTDRLPEDLPSSLRDLDKWKEGGWKDWDREQWLREAEDFANPYLPDHWKPERLREAEGNDNTVTADVETAAGSTDREPDAVRAEPVKTPYTRHAAPAGKIFMETPDGPMVCSGTVVKDPGNPGKSDLVATAGHCVHGGQGKGWFRNVMFVPAYNNSGLPESRVDGAPRGDVHPYRDWWVEWIQTTAYWMERGAASGGGGAQQDFAVLKVRTDQESGKSLEETVGTAVEIDFDAPPVERFSGISSYGYPAEAPYGGERMFRCTDRPGRYTLDPTQEPMYRIGCTMTGGMSGGGVFASDRDGEARLVSVNSLINRPDVSYAAGPRLGAAAKGVFDAISEKYAGTS
ncbi:serine protease [Streptomyces phytohabitans]|uniref:trypsin-like serine peptidase n=1 Tax=Streptomyces phytohabitans TaxID=1150371 RepID=UPI00345BE2CE